MQQMHLGAEALLASVCARGQGGCRDAVWHMMAAAQLLERRIWLLQHVATAGCCSGSCPLISVVNGLQLFLSRGRVPHSPATRAVHASWTTARNHNSGCYFDLRCPGV
jgi:hypothetical protein